MKFRASLICIALLLFFASGAAADQFDLTATGATTNISLILTGTYSGTPGLYDITSISGIVDGQNATLLATTGPGVISNSNVVSGWYIQYDNLLNLNQPYVDYYGLGMTLADGTLVNLYYNGGYLFAELGDSPPFQESVTITSVPEPGTLAMLFAGLLAIVVLARKQLS